ncbi:Holliday junction ATP-dependent DNA helicase RuvA [Siccirubricoccus deserti]|uniref:Holliday junction branch migration complex subunit RuvA n=1 Tax=Siccirubricoccus deserti TaxID=2013562 RepID=A0A9X0QXR3_9PROT|nr:Holliday junction branch migration protein RuvA [Siccirubricoccus deserti]MBC4015172.1 Holliday junction branch migration protein RuvA [Siccirubricoccus deserti]GGC38408.1 Holliday junction ATP-dependent DNA helicase RuvA [Siccirubricoccus deserti]
MIGKLTGKLDSLHEGGCILDVNGVGYLLSCSTKTLDRLRDAPQAARVLVETHVRQDAIVLFGFATAQERDTFTKLTSIQGVGPKVALDILSAFGPEELAGAVRAADRAGLRQANGVGPRLADRLVTELRDWAGGIQPASGIALPAAPGAAPPPGAEADAVSALINLGWKRPEAQAAVSRAKARLGEGAVLESLIRDSLKELAR